MAGMGFTDGLPCSLSVEGTSERGQEERERSWFYSPGSLVLCPLLYAAVPFRHVSPTTLPPAFLQLTLEI